MRLIERALALLEWLRLKAIGPSFEELVHRDLEAMMHSRWDAAAAEPIKRVPVEARFRKFGATRPETSRGVLGAPLQSNSESSGASIDGCLSDEELRDAERIIRVLRERGVEISLAEAAALWRAYSAGLAAGWLALPSGDDVLFDQLGGGAR